MPRHNTQLHQPPPTSALTTDLARLESRAYGIGEWAAGILQRYHAQLASFSKEDTQALAHLHAWVFVPLTLWPFSITDLLHQCLQQVEKGQPLHPQLRLGINLLPDVPDETVCETVAEHERQVQRGNYENVVNTQSKFAQAEMALRVEPSFQSDWQSIKTTFDVKAFQDHKGVIRRTMDTERNLRPNFTIKLQDPAEIFRLAFDAFCLRWHLYGMMHDEPLLLKLAVNVTPHSTMIIIPSFWSFDAKRDIRWNAVKELHGLRAPKKQGEALAEGRAERMALAKRLHHWDAKAKQQNLKGEAKHRFLCQGLGLVEETSPKRLARLRKEFPSH
jgi:hypothetical protein